MIVMMQKLRKTGTSYVVAIPKEVRELLGWKQNDTILLVVEEESVILRKITDQEAIAIARGGKPKKE